MIFAQESLKALHPPGCRVSFFVQLEKSFLYFYTKCVIMKVGRALFLVIFLSILFPRAALKPLFCYGFKYELTFFGKESDADVALRLG